MWAVKTCIGNFPSNNTSYNILFLQLLFKNIEVSIYN